MPDKFGDLGRLLHILDAIESIESYVGNVDFARFSSETMRFDACIRQLSVLGEAANHLSDQLYHSVNEIPWPEIIALRNLVIHEYFGVDKRVIWKIIQENIPPFKEQIVSIIQQMK
jgi:uncharacterized protein with HEPN domain